jgi:hypothetical protein
MCGKRSIRNDALVEGAAQIDGAERDAQSLVLAMAGRHVALDELSGDRLAELRTRVGTA